MRFQLPQFVETEVKLVGPFTLKQFLWIAFGGAIITVIYMLIPNLFLFAVVGIPIAAFFIAMAFAKVGGVSLPNYLSYMLSYTLNPRKYTYAQKIKEEEEYYKMPESTPEASQKEEEKK